MSYQTTSSQLSPQAAARLLLERREAADSLIKFTKYTKPEFEFNWHHEDICNALERVERGECKRLIIEAPPRHTKSELASRRFPAWFIGRNSGQQIITATYNGDFAADFGRDVRGIVDSPRYAHVFDGVSLRNDSKAANRWHTSDGGVYVAAGVGTALTGRGAHLALIDDPFKDREEADSENRRKKVWDWYRSVLLTRLMPGGAVIVIATRWHEMDLTGMILETAEETGEEWEVLKFPAIQDDGEALWPDWYGLDYLNTLKDTLGPREWLSLYMQSPTAEEGLQFQRDWFRYYDNKPEHLNVYMSGDFAVTDDGGDFTELATWGVDPDDNVYVLDWWYGQTNAETWVEELTDRFQADTPLWFVGEQGPIRKAVEPWLSKSMRDKRAYTRLEWLPTVANNKVAGARSFEALVSSGKVYFPREPWAERVIDQLLRFPAGRYDDAVDTCSLFGRMIAKTWEAQKPSKPEDPLKNKGHSDLTMPGLDDGFEAL